MQRVLPEWSGDELIYVEPTQVARSFGYNIFSSEHGNETLAWNQQTVESIPQVDGPVAESQVEYEDPATAAREIKAIATELGAAMVGITHVDPFHIYKGMDLSHRYAIVLAVPMDYDEMKYGATERHVREVIKIYAIAGKLAVELGKRIRAMGYPARAHTLRFEQLNMLPHAVAAGLGELGKHASLINQELGCSFRLATVTTDLPLAIDEPRDWGVNATCENCNMCVTHCPGDAISHEKQEIRGNLRWTIDTESCAPYWGTYYACGICLEVCPFNARTEDGKYKDSLIERINKLDRKGWNRELEAGLQQPWEHVEEPTEHDEGWRNYVEGKADADHLIQGIPVDGLPDSVYEMREAMGIKERHRPESGRS